MCHVTRIWLHTTRSAHGEVGKQTSSRDSTRFAGSADQSSIQYVERIRQKRIPEQPLRATPGYGCRQFWAGHLFALSAGWEERHRGVREQWTRKLVLYRSSGAVEQWQFASLVLSSLCICPSRLLIDRELETHEGIEKCKHEDPISSNTV